MIMNATKNISLIVLLFVICLSSEASKKREQYFSHLGKYGIELQSNNDYSKYIGKDVMYIREPTSDFPCEKNKLLTIKKFSVDKDKISINLVEKDGKKKYKLEASIGYQTNFWGTKFKEDFRIDNSKTVPLLLIDEYNATQKEWLGKEFVGESGNKYKVVDLPIDETGFKFVYKSISTGEEFMIHCYYSDALKLIGKKYTHPEVKGFYEIVEIEDHIDKKEGNYKVGVRYSESKTNQIFQYMLDELPWKAFAFDVETQLTATLVQVEKPENSDIRYGETIAINDSSVTKYRYTDNVIDIIIFAENKYFSFNLKNNSKSSIKVVWDEAAFIDHNGETSKVMHNGIKYSERESSQPASVIIKGAKLDDVAIPTKCVSYSNSLKEWTTDPMLIKEGEVKLMIPIQIKETVNEYVFAFNVKRKYKHPQFIKEKYLKMTDQFE